MLEDRIADYETRLRSEPNPDVKVADDRVRQVATDAALQWEYETAADRLVACRERLRTAERLRQAAYAEIGAVMRRQKAIHDQYQQEYLRVDITRAAHITELSRPTIYKAIEDTAGADEQWDMSHWSDERLARAIQDGYPGGEEVKDEFRLRFPFVAALLDAAGVLGDKMRAEQEFPWMEVLDHRAPGEHELVAEYNDRVAAIGERASWPDGKFRWRQGDSGIF